MRQRIIEAKEMAEGLREALAGLAFDRLFIITDSNVEREVLPQLRPEREVLPQLCQAGSTTVIVVEPGEASKNIESVQRIWQWFTEKGATRHSLILNIGGGMVTDLGGFAAATFKRGLRFINVPTTLLGAVDAAVGGKTGIDFLGLKNEIGVFAPAEAVVVSTSPFSSLPEKEWISGYAELIKTLIISNKELYRQALTIDIGEAATRFLGYAVREKQRITEADPREQGLRRRLNFGHTAGHALEALFLEKQPDNPLTHGRAVAFGMMTALLLSHLLEELPMTEVYAYRDEILRQNFGSLNLSCTDIDRMIALMGHDKKNREAGRIGFVLLRGIGDPVFRDDIPHEEIRTALELTFT